MNIVIPEEWDGKTLKKYLFSGLGFSRAQVVSLKARSDGMLLDGERVFVSAVLRAGQTLTLATEDRTDSPMIRPVDLPIDVLYEDEYLIAVNKPPSMPTHPSLYHYDDTLANALAYYFSSLNRPFVFRVVNRLDRDTSGVVLASKDKHTAFLMSRLIAAREADKRYVALLDGETEEDGGFIDKKIVRTENSIITRRTDDREGVCALTEYTVLARSSGHTLVCAVPHTGRTHQLRVHFASIGHPVTGDTLYGSPDAHIGRQALHARSITFIHPILHKEMKILAPLPEDIKQVLKEYGFEKTVVPD